MIKYMEKINLHNEDKINNHDSILIRQKIVTVFDKIKDTITLMTVIYPNNKKNYDILYKNAHKLLEYKINQGWNNRLKYSLNTK